jgi:geranylgeranyl pyrophosphate synthase
MDLGLSTAPILYATQEYKELRPLVMRRFKDKGDKQTALEYLYKSPTAMNKARALALFHAEVSIFVSDDMMNVVSLQTVCIVHDYGT